MIRETNDQTTVGTVPIPPELVEAARTGDQGAFTELYERTCPVLYRTICAMVRDEDLVWDILQDSFIRAFRGLAGLESAEAFLPWLRRIAVNVTASRLAKSLPVTFTELAGEEGREPDFPDLNPENLPEQALERRELIGLVRKLLGTLPKEQQLILGMFYYEDMSVREIAEALHLASGTVKAQLHRGRKRIEAGVRALDKLETAGCRSA